MQNQQATAALRFRAQGVGDMSDKVVNPLRVFSKLAARVPPFISMGGATGAPELDPSEAAALCAGLPQHPYMAARFLWAGDMSAGEWIRIELQRRAMEMSQARWVHDKKWMERLVGHIKKECGRAPSLVLADLVVMQAMRPAIYGETMHQMAYVGLKSADKTDRALWYRYVRPRYYEVATVFDGWVGHAFAHVNAAQREEGDCE